MQRPHSAGSTSTETFNRVIRGGVRDRRNSRRELDIADESHETYDNKRLWRTFLDTVDTKALDKEARFEILRFAVKNPIPQRHRLRLWRHHVFREPVVDAAELKGLISGELQPETNAAIESILMDIPRTPWVSEADEEESLAKLLIAFSMRHPEIGYTQGLNLVGMIPLVVGFNEYEALALLEKIVCDGEGGILEGCPGKEDLTVFQRKAATSSILICEVFPELGAKLAEAKIDFTLVAFDAFLSLFASRMPLHAVLRFWDFSLLAHTTQVLPEHLPSATVLSLLVAQLQTILLPLSDQDEDQDGHFLVTFHRILADLTPQQTDLCLAAALDILPTVGASLARLAAVSSASPTASSVFSSASDDESSSQEESEEES